MSLFQMLESWTEGLLRIAIGVGLTWIGIVERGGYGAFLDIVGVIFVIAGIAEIWSVEAAAFQARKVKTMNSIHPALSTDDIPVFYASTYGQARRIAERLVATFREKGFTSSAIDMAGPDGDYVDWRRAQAVVVCASVHAHKHQRAAAAFCDEYAPHLNVLPSAFVSVSLSAASDRAEERRDAARIAREFVDGVEWKAEEVACVAGALAYTRYGWMTRLIMKYIARRHGQPTDTSRDYEFTNWDEVARIADDVIRSIAAERAHRVA